MFLSLVNDFLKQDNLDKKHFLIKLRKIYFWSVL